jgi:hypothetical protein
LVDSTPPQNTPSRSLSAQPYIATFDGTACSASGPAELPPGEHSFILNNSSDLDVALEVAHFHPGKTLQDLLDIQKEPGVWWPKPSWLEYTSAKGPPWSTDDGGIVRTYRTYIQADYVIYVIIFDFGNDPTENKLWFCHQFSVVESPSE